MNNQTMQSAVSFVPVSMAAKDWNVSTRRICFLLAAGRLEGRKQANGYWEVIYPLPLHLREPWNVFKTLSEE